jgi:hypothetical protein
MAAGQSTGFGEGCGPICAARLRAIGVIRHSSHRSRAARNRTIGLVAAVRVFAGARPTVARLPRNIPRASPFQKKDMVTI